jgi:hypothetical protein
MAGDCKPIAATRQESLGDGANSTKGLGTKLCHTDEILMVMAPITVNELVFCSQTGNDRLNNPATS